MPTREITARGKIILNEKGLQTLHIDNPEWWQGELCRFSPDTAVVVTIKKWYKKRSLDQNNTFHWYVGVLADYFGYAPDTMKQLIALKWLKEPLYDAKGEQAVDVTTGELLFELKSTTSLSTVEMADLCTAIRQWADEGWGIILPEPDKNYKLNFKNQ